VKFQPNQPKESEEKEKKDDEDEDEMDEVDEQYHKIAILEYLFPLKMFNLMLDNLSNHQIIDLYHRYAGQSDESLRNKSVNYDTKIS
jgi:hypothetical protein